MKALGSYRGAPFVTGHFGYGDSSIYGLKTEILDYENKKWNQAEDYPFATDRRVRENRMISTFNGTQLTRVNEYEKTGPSEVESLIKFLSVSHIMRLPIQKKAFLLLVELAAKD